MTKPYFKSVGLFSKPGSTVAWDALQRVAQLLPNRGASALSSPDAWQGNAWAEDFCEQVRANADVALAIGGDGTLIGVARSLFGSGIPILGVNLGTLGYLTEVPAELLAEAVHRMLDGDFDIEQRTMLETRIEGGDETALAFNDVVLSKGDHGQMVTFDVFVDNAPVYRLRADGLIICTPTGSTAYSLSANGPILHPALPALALVPLAPHSMTARPITLPSSSKVEIVLQGSTPGRLHCDGLVFGDLLEAGARITVSQARHSADMLHLRGYSVFTALREKLGWSSVIRD